MRLINADKLFEQVENLYKSAQTPERQVYSKILDMISESQTEVELNKIQSNILNIAENSIVKMTVHGETNIYKPFKNSDDSWDMIVNEDFIYGLSCKDINELKVYLLADYATGIITKVE